VKVILETSRLGREQKVIAAALAKCAGAAYVKTCTGFGGGGATLEDVALLRAVVGDDMGVKASGGIRTADHALAMLDAGASRLGTSASVAIVTGAFGGRR
jgi:deoxyribose-phosphate aldolase